MGNTRIKSEGHNMPDNATCPCMREDGWNTYSGVVGGHFGRAVREMIDGSGACEKGVRDLLVSVIVGSIVAAEGSVGVENVDEILSGVKRRIENK